MWAWTDPVFFRTAVIVLTVIFGSGAVVYAFRRKNFYFISAWASIRSWLLAAPLMFLAFSAPPPWPLLFLTLLAVYGAKAFFQILGMYHRQVFVNICYAGIWALGYITFKGRLELYNLMPLIVLGAACLVPLVMNTHTQMIQFISLTLLAFVFLGWSFLHLGLLLQFPSGLYQILYLIVLTEFCDNTSIATSFYLRGEKLLPNIDPKRTWASTIASVLLTLVLAFAMRTLLPDDAEKYWLACGLVASVGGVLGDLTMTAIRRDAGARDAGPFIIGRGDILMRMDRLIFVAPIYFYVMHYLDIF